LNCNSVIKKFYYLEDFRLENRAAELARLIEKKNFVKIVTHIDADGITAGSIASVVLERKGIPHKVEFLKQLDIAAIERLKGEGNPLVWFTDLGSGMLEHLSGLECVICDHVPSVRTGRKPPSLKREQITDILAFSEAYTSNTTDDDRLQPLQLNPHSFGRDGSYDMSGAGAAYLVGKAMSPDNRDLAALAIVGAVGDIQAARERRVTGTNREILKDGIDAGVLNALTDICFFGRETRPVYKLLQYSSDIILPGLSNHEGNSVAFIEKLGIEQKDGEKWLSWTQFTLDDRRKIVSELAKLLIEKGFGHDAALKLIGEVYELPQEKENTELRDAKEFSTLLNSCGRYKNAYVGYRVCVGDRGEYLDKALGLLRGHRQTLVNCLKTVKESGLVIREKLQYFDGGDRIPESVVGIVANMVLSQNEVDSSIPVFGFTNSEDDGMIKVSARGTQVLVSKGLKLNEVMNITAEKFGGIGGGHNIAAGATIPEKNKEEFLNAAETLIAKQLLKNG
jgi:RecJ-like exonuclease